MRRILTVIGVLILACIILGILAFVLAGPAIGNVFNSTVALTDTSTKFMTALKNQKYGDAYGMIATDQQASFGGGADGIKQLMDGIGAGDLTSWNFTSFNINNDQGTVGGDATFGGTTKKTLQIVLQKVGDGWKVIGLHIQ